MTDPAWAQSLKPGDKVAVSGRYMGHPPFFVLTVAKLTATQVVTECGKRFALKDLYEIGAPKGTFRGRPCIQPVTHRVLEAVETFELVNWLASLVSEHGRKYPPLHVMRAMKSAHDAAVVGAGQVSGAVGSPP